MIYPSQDVPAIGDYSFWKSDQILKAKQIKKMSIEELEDGLVHVTAVAMTDPRRTICYIYAVDWVDIFNRMLEYRRGQ